MSDFSCLINKNGSDASSEGSSPEPPAPFLPKFVVTLTDHVTKDGDAVKFTIKVYQSDQVVSVISRIYEDFEYLEHCVITDQLSYGLIIPPLPPLVAIDAESAVAYTKKHMGKGTKTILGDDFRKDCRQLQKYLNLLLCHPVLGQSPRLQEFLLNNKAPPRTKVRKGVIAKLSDSLEARRVSYRDCEDFFQKERNWLAKYSVAIDQFSQNFDKIVYAQIKIMHQLEQIVVAVKLNQCMKWAPLYFNSLNQIYLNCVDHEKIDMEEKCVEEDLQFGCLLSLWAKYMAAEESMLLTRTSLMIDYQMCNRALEKAKPNRKGIKLTRHTMLAFRTNIANLFIVSSIPYKTTLTAGFMFPITEANTTLELPFQEWDLLTSRVSIFVHFECNF